jgi:hypothetical protein
VRYGGMWHSLSAISPIRSGGALRGSAGADVLNCGRAVSPLEQMHLEEMPFQTRTNRLLTVA